jgi:hypothetical protein
MRTRITPSLLIASLALAVAVSGGAGYAAGSLPHHSVGAAQLKKNAVTGKAIKAGAVTGDKVADGSLSGADLAANSVTGTQVDESSLSIPLRPGSVLLSGLDFAPRSSSDVTTSSSDGGVSGNSGVNTTYVDATVPLPAGATVTHVTFYVRDNGPGVVGLFVVPVTPAPGAVDYGHQLLTTGADPAIQALTGPTVQPGAGQVLNLLVVLPTGLTYGLYGAKVDYS